MNISDILDRRHVIPGLAAHGKDALLDDLARRAAVALKLEHRPILAALKERERLGSTGVGQGIAVPHARIEGLPAIFGMFARIEPAIDFDAIDRQPVDLVFLLLAPAQGSISHLSALAAVSRRLRDAAATKAIRAAANATNIYAALVA